MAVTVNGLSVSVAGVQVYFILAVIGSVGIVWGYPPNTAHTAIRSPNTASKCH